jgi:polysaccharide biosynthesis protein PslH
MKIMLLTQVLPYPPDSGPKVKTLNLIKYLSKFHQVTLVSFVRGDQSSEVQSLQQYCEAVHTVPIERGAGLDARYMMRSFLSRQPFLMVRDDRPEMRRLVDELASRQQFDIVHADQLNMAQYALRVPGARRILDAHNALWLLYQRLWKTMKPGPKKWLLGRDWRLLKKYEGDVLHQFHVTLAVSEEDRTALQEAAQTIQKRGEAHIAVIPITVDTDEVRRVERSPGADRILHMGTMYWPPNVDGVLWFIENVYPLIRSKRPGVEFDVVGARPPRELVEHSGNGTGINVTGYVEDPLPYLEQTGAVVVPLRAGGGMRVKILNALAQGLPVVTTTIGCEGIPVQNGTHLLIADTPEEFAAATLRFLEDRPYADQLGQRGRHFIQARYDYRVACEPIEQIYRGASAEMRPPESFHNVVS